MKYPKIQALIILALWAGTLLGQEFDCEVTVNDDKLEGNSFDYVATSLASDLEDYINNYRWTEYDFREEERIKCKINIILVEGSDNFNFTSEVVIQSRRPIYNTILETTTLIINDQSWIFSYPKGRSLIHDDLQFEPLTGFIDYYCYLLLGYDFDTFSPLGGTEFFRKAQNVVDLAQNEDAVGWSQNINNRRNRFVLVSDLLNSNFEPIRKAYYNYHRIALDTFVSAPEQAREQVISTLDTMLEIKRRSTSTYLFDLFFDTKSREIASIFEKANSQIKLEAYNILSELDASHLTEYEVLQN